MIGILSVLRLEFTDINQARPVFGASQNGFKVASASTDFSFPGFEKPEQKNIQHVVSQYYVS